ncbi:MAG TPA: TetR/AcrR family transcriptional regulator [Feifaniaceae bacterium]|nr:TetR/AcrR family transcriptional regulator [Feifaniaceae bacterium]
MTELFERIPAEKRMRILETAMEEFARCGYENANTNTIAKKAGISVGSLYQYFTGKEDLFLTTVKHCSAALKETLEEIMRREEEDILVKVEKVLRAIQKHSRENRSMIHLYNEMTTNSNSELMLQSVDEIEGMTSRMYTELVRRLQKEGEVRKDCDPGIFAFLLDNLFMSMQFSYACEYYARRFTLYAGGDVFARDDYVVEQTLKFIKGAFTVPKKR